MTVSELLKKSGEVVREKGWAKGVRQASEYYDGYKPGAVCALGAIEVALWDASLLPRGVYLEASKLGCAARDILAQHVPEPPDRKVANNGCRIAEWNNKVATSPEEVIATFNAAAECAAHKVAS